MATTDKFLGTQIAAYVNNKKVFNATSHTFSMDTDMVDVTDNDTGGWKAFLPGNKGGKISIEGNAEQQASVTNTYCSFEDLLDFQVNGTALTIHMNTGSTGDLKLIGTAYLSNTQLTGSNGDKVTFSADLQFTGQITVASQS